MFKALVVPQRQGIALVFALVFAVVLLQFAIAYSGLVRQSRPQTDKIDERVRLHYLANGLAEIALLKYQKFPADFYYCWSYASETATTGPLKAFTVDAPEFKIENFMSSSSSFNSEPITIKITDMKLLTNNPWKTEALEIKATACYKPRTGGEEIEVVAGRIVRTERKRQGP